MISCLWILRWHRHEKLKRASGKAKTIYASIVRLVLAFWYTSTRAARWIKQRKLS